MQDLRNQVLNSELMVRTDQVLDRGEKRSQELTKFKNYNFKSKIGHNCLLELFFVICFFSVPPKLGSISFANEIFDEGQSAQIMCSVSEGDEPLTMTWSFHGNDISSGSSGIVTSNFGSTTSFLMIKSVSQGHRGVYTCRAKNTAGSATSTAELRVNG